MRNASKIFILHTMFVLLLALSFPSEAAADTSDSSPHTQIFELSYESDGARSPCISCLFLLQFSVAFSTFSAVAYLFFAKVFTVLTPVLFAIWLTWRAAALMINGGAGGWGFFQSIAKNIAIFSFLWMVVATPSGDRQSDAAIARAGFLWQAVGPGVLNFSFGVGNDMRDHVFTGLSAAPGQGDLARNAAGAMGCGGAETFLRNNDPNGAGEGVRKAVLGVVQYGCMVERVHVLAAGTSAAIMLSVARTPSSIMDAGARILLWVLGFFCFVSVVMSAVWFIFLILDVFVKAMTVSVVAPIMTLLWVFPETRKMGWRIFRSYASVPFLLIGLTLVNVLAFFLLINIVNVYEMTRESIKSSLYSGRDTTLNALEGMNDLQKFYVFIQRSGLSASDPQAIPNGLTEPWTIYMIFSVLVIFSLGKKIMAIIGNILPDQGDAPDSTMADEAMSGVKTAKKVVGKVATVAAVALPATAVAMMMTRKAGVALAKKVNPMGSRRKQEDQG